MTIELLHTNSCEGHYRALEELERALVKADIEPRYETLLIRDAVDAKRHQFRGSPTIRINGKDIENDGGPETENHGTAVCRIYIFEGRVYDYPPRELILKAIRKHMG